MWLFCTTFVCWSVRFCKVSDDVHTSLQSDRSRSNRRIGDPLSSSMSSKMLGWQEYSHFLKVRLAVPLAPCPRWYLSWWASGWSKLRIAPLKSILSSATFPKWFPETHRGSLRTAASCCRAVLSWCGTQHWFRANDGGYVWSLVCERVCEVGPGRYSFWCRGRGGVWNCALGVWQLSHWNFRSYSSLAWHQSVRTSSFSSRSTLLEFFYSFTPDVFFSFPGGFDVLGKFAKIW